MCVCAIMPLRMIQPIRNLIIFSLFSLFAGTVVMSFVLWTAIDTMFRPLAQDALLPCIIAGKETSWLALDTKCGRLQVRSFQLAAATVASAPRT